MHTTIHTALFLSAQYWKQPKCLSPANGYMHGGTATLRNINAAVGMNPLQPNASVWMHLTDHMLTKET